MNLFFKSSKKIAPNDVVQLVGQGNAYLIDVRTRQEYQQAHIKGSVNIPLDTLANQITRLVGDKQACVIVYCQSGARSKQAYFMLEGLGYTNVYDLGGINAWPYDTTRN